MTEFDYQPRTRVLSGAGSIDRLSEVARDLAFRRTLLVSDPGIVAAGYAEAATRLLEQGGAAVFPFHDFGPNPETSQVHVARDFARPLQIDSIVALGGGSSMDLAKAVNIVLHNPGSIEDYQGYAKGTGRLAPMIAVPTTSGTGSEAQSYAVIARAGSHLKMAVGDPQAAFRAAILDPALTLSQPAAITATAGYDAISHAVESFVTTRRNSLSCCFAREAWRLLSANLERVLEAPGDLEARSAMQVGAHLAGAAIENSMLGATHACANPLTARYGISHGSAIAIMLPNVVAWNMTSVAGLYRELEPGDLVHRLAGLAAAAGLPSRLRDCGVSPADFAELAAAAAGQWTGRFNPRPFDRQAAEELYQCTY